MFESSAAGAADAASGLSPRALRPAVPSRAGSPIQICRSPPAALSACGQDPSSGGNRGENELNAQKPSLRSPLSSESPSPYSSSAVSPPRLQLSPSPSRGRESRERGRGAGEQRAGGEAEEKWGWTAAGAPQSFRPSGIPSAAAQFAEPSSGSTALGLRTEDASSLAADVTKTRRAPRQGLPSGSAGSRTCSRSSPHSVSSPSSSSPSSLFSSPSSFSCLREPLPGRRPCGTNAGQSRRERSPESTGSEAERPCGWDTSRGTMDVSSPCSARGRRGPSPLAAPSSPVVAPLPSGVSPRLRSAACHHCSDPSPSKLRCLSPRRAEERQGSAAPSPLQCSGPVCPEAGSTVLPAPHMLFPGGLSPPLISKSSGESGTRHSPRARCATSPKPASLCTSLSAAVLSSSSPCVSSSSVASSANLPSADPLSHSSPLVSSASGIASSSPLIPSSASPRASSPTPSWSAPDEGSCARADPEASKASALNGTAAAQSALREKPTEGVHSDRNSGTPRSSASDAAGSLHASAAASRLSRPDDRTDTATSLACGVDGEREDLSTRNEAASGVRREESSAGGAASSVFLDATSQSRREELEGRVASAHPQRGVEHSHREGDAAEDQQTQDEASRSAHFPELPNLGAHPPRENSDSVRQTSSREIGVFRDSRSSLSRPSAAFEASVDVRWEGDTDRARREGVSSPSGVSDPTAGVRDQAGRSRGRTEGLGDRRQVAEGDAEEAPPSLEGERAVNRADRHAGGGDSALGPDCGAGGKEAAVSRRPSEGAKRAVETSPARQAERVEDPVGVAFSVLGGEKASATGRGNAEVRPDSSRSPEARTRELTKQEGRFLSAENLPLPFSPSATSQWVSDGGEDESARASSFCSAWSPSEPRQENRSEGVSGWQGPSDLAHGVQASSLLAAASTRPDRGEAGVVCGRLGAHDHFFSPEASHAFASASSSQYEGQLASAPTSSFHTPREALTVEGFDLTCWGESLHKRTEGEPRGDADEDLGSEFRTARGSRRLERDSLTHLAAAGPAGEAHAAATGVSETETAVTRILDGGDGAPALREAGHAWEHASLLSVEDRSAEGPGDGGRDPSSLPAIPCLVTRENGDVEGDESSESRGSLGEEDGQNRGALDNGTQDSGRESRESEERSSLREQSDDRERGPSAAENGHGEASFPAFQVSEQPVAVSPAERSPKDGKERLLSTQADAEDTLPAQDLPLPPREEREKEGEVESSRPQVAPHPECRSPVFLRERAGDADVPVAAFPEENLPLPVSENQARRLAFPSAAGEKAHSERLSLQTLPSMERHASGYRRLSLASDTSGPRRHSFFQGGGASDDGRQAMSPSCLPQTKRYSFLAMSGDESVSSLSQFSGEESAGRARRLGPKRERERRRRQEGDRYFPVSDNRAPFLPGVSPGYAFPSGGSQAGSPASDPGTHPRRMVGGACSPPGEPQSPFLCSRGPEAVASEARPPLTGLSATPGASPRTAPFYAPGGDAAARGAPSEVSAQRPPVHQHGVAASPGAGVPFAFPQKLSPGERRPSPGGQPQQPFVGVSPQILLQQQQLFLQATAAHPLRGGVPSPPQTALQVAPQHLLVPVGPSVSPLHHAALAARRPPGANAMSPVEMHPAVPFLPFFPVAQSAPPVAPGYPGGPGPAAPLMPVSPPFSGFAPVPPMAGPSPVPVVVEGPAAVVPPAPHTQGAMRCGTGASREGPQKGERGETGAGTNPQAPCAASPPGAGTPPSGGPCLHDQIHTAIQSLQELSQQLGHQHQLQRLQQQLLASQSSALPDGARNLRAFGGRAPRAAANAPTAPAPPAVPVGLGSPDRGPSRVETGADRKGAGRGEAGEPANPEGGRGASPAEVAGEAEPDSGAVFPGNGGAAPASARAQNGSGASSVSPPTSSPDSSSPSRQPTPPAAGAPALPSAASPGPSGSSPAGPVGPSGVSVPEASSASQPPAAPLSQSANPVPALAPVGAAPVPSSSYASPPHQVCRILLLSEQLLQQLLHHVTPTASARDEKRLLYNSLVHFVHNILGSEHLRAMIEAVQQQLAHAGESALGSDWPLRNVQLQLVDSARVPILTLRTPDASVVCDISVNTSNSIWHSEFFSFVLQQRPQLRPLMRLLKVWVRNRKLPTMKEGGLPSIVWMILAVYFCHGGQRHQLRTSRAGDEGACNSRADRAAGLLGAAASEGRARERGNEEKSVGDAQAGRRSDKDADESEAAQGDGETGPKAVGRVPSASLASSPKNGAGQAEPPQSPEASDGGAGNGTASSAHLVSPLGFLAPMVGLPAPILPSFFPLLLSLLQFFAHLRNRTCLSQSIFICCSPSGAAAPAGAFPRPSVAPPPAGEDWGLRQLPSASGVIAPELHQALASSAILSGGSPGGDGVRQSASGGAALPVGAASSPLLVSSVPKPRTEAAQRIISSFCHGGVWDDLLSVYDYPKTNAAYLHTVGPGGSFQAGGSAASTSTGNAGAAPGGGPGEEPAIDLAAKVSSATWLVYLYELGRAAHLLNSFLKAVNRFHLLLQILHSQAANSHLQTQLQHLRTLQIERRAAVSANGETPSEERAAKRKEEPEGSAATSRRPSAAGGDDQTASADAHEARVKGDAKTGMLETEGDEKTKLGPPGAASSGAPGSSPTFPFTQGLQLFRRDLLMGVAAIFDEISDDRYLLPATYEEEHEEPESAPADEALLDAFLSAGDAEDREDPPPEASPVSETVQTKQTGPGSDAAAVALSASSALATGCGSQIGMPPSKGLSELADSVRISVMRPATLTSKVWLLAVLEGRLCVIESNKTCQEGGWWSTQFLSRRDVRSTLHGRLYLLVGLQPLQRYLLSRQRRSRGEGRRPAANGPAETDGAASTDGKADPGETARVQAATGRGVEGQPEAGTPPEIGKDASGAETLGSGGRGDREDVDVLSGVDSVFPLSCCAQDSASSSREAGSAGDAPEDASQEEEASSFFSSEGHFPALLVPVNPESVTPPVLFSPCNFVTRLTVLQCGVPSSLARPLLSLFPSLVPGKTKGAEAGAKAPMSLRVLPSWEMARVATLHRIAATSPWFHTAAPRHQTLLHVGMRAPLQPTVARCRHCGVSGVAAVGGLLDQAEKELREAMHAKFSASAGHAGRSEARVGDAKSGDAGPPRASRETGEGPFEASPPDESGNKNDREETRTLTALAALTLAAERLETSSRSGAKAGTNAGPGSVRAPPGDAAGEERCEADRSTDDQSGKGNVRPARSAPTPAPGSSAGAGTDSGRGAGAPATVPGAGGSNAWGTRPSPPYDSAAGAHQAASFGAALGASTGPNLPMLPGKKGGVQNPAASAPPVPRPPSHLHAVASAPVGGPQHPLLSPSPLGAEGAHAGQSALGAVPGRGSAVSPVTGPAGVVPAPAAHLLPQPPPVSAQPHPPVVLLLPVTPQHLLVQHQQQLLQQQMLQQHFIQQQLAHVAAVAALNGARPPGVGVLPPRPVEHPGARPPPRMPAGVSDAPASEPGAAQNCDAAVASPSQPFEAEDLRGAQQLVFQEKAPSEKARHAGFYYGGSPAGPGRSEGSGGRGAGSNTRGAAVSTAGSAGDSRRGSQQLSSLHSEDHAGGGGFPGLGSPDAQNWGRGGVPGSSGGTSNGRVAGGGMHAGSAQAAAGGGHHPGFPTRSTGSCGGSGSPHGGSRQANGDGVPRWGPGEERGSPGFLELHAARPAELRVNQEVQGGLSQKRRDGDGFPEFTSVSGVEEDPAAVGSSNGSARTGSDGRLGLPEPSKHRRSTGDLVRGSTEASGEGAFEGPVHRGGDVERGKGSGSGRERSSSLSSISSSALVPAAGGAGEERFDEGFAGQRGRNGLPRGLKPSSLSPSVSAGPGILAGGRAKKGRVPADASVPPRNLPPADGTGSPPPRSSSFTASQADRQAAEPPSHASLPTGGVSSGPAAFPGAVCAAALVEPSPSPHIPASPPSASARSPLLTPAAAAGAPSLHPRNARASLPPSPLSPFAGAPPLLPLHAAPHGSVPFASPKTDTRPQSARGTGQARDGRQSPTYQGVACESPPSCVDDWNHEWTKSGRGGKRQESWASQRCGGNGERSQAAAGTSPCRPASPVSFYAIGSSDEPSSGQTEAASSVSRKSDESYPSAGRLSPAASSFREGCAPDPSSRARRGPGRDSGDPDRRREEDDERGNRPSSPLGIHSHRNLGATGAGYGDSEGREGQFEKGTSRTRSVEGVARLTSPSSSLQSASPQHPFDPSSVGSFGPASPTDVLERTDGAPRLRACFTGEGGAIGRRRPEYEEGREQTRLGERMNGESVASPARVAGGSEERAQLVSPASFHGDTSLSLRLMGEREETSSAPQVPSSPSSKDTPTASTPSLSERGAAQGATGDSTSSTSSRRVARERIPLKHRAEKLLYVPGALRRQKLLGQRADGQACAPIAGSASSMGQLSVDSPGETGRDRGLAIPPLSPALSLQSCSSGGPPSSGDRDRGSGSLASSSYAGFHSYVASPCTGDRDARRGQGSSTTPNYASSRTSSYHESAATSPGTSFASSPSSYPASRHEPHSHSAGVTGLFGGYHASRNGGNACSRSSSRDSEGRGVSVASASAPATFAGARSGNYRKGAGPDTSRERFAYQDQHDYEEGRKLHAGERLGGRGPPPPSQGIFAYNGAHAFASSASDQQRFTPYGRASGASSGSSGASSVRFRPGEGLDEGGPRASYRGEGTQGPRYASLSGAVGPGERGTGPGSYPGYPPSHHSFMSPKEALRTRHRVVEEVHWRLAHNRKVLSESAHGSANLDHAFAGAPATPVGSDRQSASAAGSGQSSTGGGYLSSQKACSSFAEGQAKAQWVTSSAPAAVGPGPAGECSPPQSPTPDSMCEDESPRSRRDAGATYPSPRDRDRVGPSSFFDRGEDDFPYSGRRGSCHEAHAYANSHFCRRGESSRIPCGIEPSRTTSGGASLPSFRRRPTGSQSHVASPSFQPGASSTATPGPSGFGAAGRGHSSRGSNGGGGVSPFASGYSHDGHATATPGSAGSGMSKNGQARLLHAALNCAVGRSESSGSSPFASSPQFAGVGHFSSRNAEAGRGGRGYASAGGERRLENAASGDLETPPLGARRESSAASGSDDDGRGQER
ncbi:conserved hypothetical protein [Neospora caninum Liverpool]|uniref:Uncharacterized protein n=1 Tax=Neospora caninum (strain Liverpool) TaxID=572307 RepID=F0VAL7_NEOCL|nr:conserved hypothetical protein [Neospora caninum Liverpool]CBZ50772.1 conserved hypothetical protein [Neospora caninum Liverpool]|eukprot:XP_003880805.1 conserved hypothetical protein [Neospora caninum Liverpool]